MLNSSCGSTQAVDRETGHHRNEIYDIVVTIIVLNLYFNRCSPAYICYNDDCSRVSCTLANKSLNIVLLFSFSLILRSDSFLIAQSAGTT